MQAAAALEVLLNSTVPLANNPYPVVVGAGGAFISASDLSSGLDSKFNTAVAAGGGRGAHYNPVLASYRGADAGGSGGGAESHPRCSKYGQWCWKRICSEFSSSPRPAPGQGNAGGNSPSPNNPGNDTGGGGVGGIPMVPVEM